MQMATYVPTSEKSYIHFETWAKETFLSPHQGFKVKTSSVMYTRQLPTTWNLSVCAFYQKTRLFFNLKYMKFVTQKLHKYITNLI